MTWLAAMLNDGSVAGVLVGLSAVIVVGLALGSVRIRGIGLGVAGVLFAGLAAGRLGLKPDPNLLQFVREFGLILFVYTIGLQVGPGFLASLRRSGLRLNLLACGVVLTGTLLAVGAVKWLGVTTPAGVGLLAGATTNTPSLAAAEEALRQRSASAEAGAAAAELIGAGYAIAYPLGIVGIIGVLLASRMLPVLRPRESAAAGPAAESVEHRITFINLEVTNANLRGLPLRRLPLTTEAGVVVSRMLHKSTLRVPTGDEPLELGDVLLAVGEEESLQALRMLVGQESPLNLRDYPSEISSRRLVVTRAEVAGRTLAELQLRERLGVTATRLSRAGVEFTASPHTTLNLADTVLVVGPEDSIRRAAALLGDTPRRLDHPMLVPVFVGIALGVLAGSLPLALPGLPGTVKLGLAGGPLVVAIVLSSLGRVGPLVWYMPLSANFMLREMGIVLFLACVGIKSGHTFFASLAGGEGLRWLAIGAGITVIPLVLAALVGALIMRLPGPTLCGVLAGSMTDPPALALANTLAGSDAPSVAYATVYPLTMLMRVVCAQALVILLL
jgi:putative transport protein